MKKLTTLGVVLTLGLFALGSFFISRAEAQEACGMITAPHNFFVTSSSITGLFSNPVESCNNPFGSDLNIPSPYSLKVEGMEVPAGATVTVPVGGTIDIKITGGPILDRYVLSLFKKEGSDYHFVNLAPETVPSAYYYDFIFRYFATSQTRSIYRPILDSYLSGESLEPYFKDEAGQPLLDNNAQEIEVKFNSYLETVGQTFFAEYPRVTSGTYVAVVKDVSSDLGSEYIHAIPFSLAEGDTPGVTGGETTSPSGAPSVIFFPGIMGSNLYEESDECNLFGGVDEVKRWVSTFDCDVERLVMDENGVSINNLYTKTEDGVVEDVFLVSNLYDSFIEELADLKDEDKIAGYRAVPYDWRLRLSDVLKTVNTGGRITLDPEANYQDGYVYKSLEAMVAASPSEKVVLVGHSNGGLVIKTLLATMKANNDPLLDSIEKVVLVAVPQAGTPEAVVGMLHGVEIGIAGVAVDQVQSRQLINTAPFGYHLLPDYGYFEMVDTPVITIESGTSTDAWRGQFGAEIDTKEELNYFLEKGSGRPTPAWSDTHTPATAYAGLLNYARSAHSFVTDWQPDETKVYEVAGTGVDTPANVTYFTDTHCERGDVLMNGTVVCGKTSAKFGYRINTVIDGDGTVVTPSALAVPLSQGSEKWYLDLEEYDSFTRLERKHKNIFEVEDVRSLVSGVISSSTLEGYRFLSKTEPAFEGEERLVYRLHSPLDLYVVLHDGEVVGSSTTYLRGVEYRRYGELQQLSIPEGENGYEIRLSGIAAGSFTLDIDSYEGDDLVDRQTYSAVPSSTSTQVSLKVEEGEEAVLEIDYQGDGVFEAMALPGLAVIVPVSTPVTTTPAVSESRNSSSGTRVGMRVLPSAPGGALASGQIVTRTQQALMLQLIALLTQYRDLLIKLKVQ